MKNYILTIGVLFVLIACNSNTKQEKVEEPSLSGLVEIESPSGSGSAEPHLFTDPSGTTFLSWVEEKETSDEMKFSVLEGDVWKEASPIASGDNWFVNWADYPMIGSDGTGNLIAHYLAKSADGTFTYDVNTVQSNDAGANWTAGKVLHDDGIKAEHGFATLIPYNGNFFVAWLDGRNTAMPEGMENDGGHHGAMTIRAAILSPTGQKLNEWELDAKTCDCCQTTAAITANGPVVLYRDRSDEEIRDMAIVRLVDNEWTEPELIYNDNWKIQGCPVNGPRSASIGNNLVVGWFTIPNNEAQVKVAFSKDGGATFDSPIRVDKGKSIGRVDIELIDEKTALVSWMEGSEINVAKVKSDGTVSNPMVIATSSDSRASGFPQMSLNGARAIFAWTDPENGGVKSGYLNLDIISQ